MSNCLFYGRGCILTLPGMAKRVSFISMIIPVLLAAFLVQDSVPFKPQDEFKVAFELSFKKRNETSDFNVFRMSETVSERDRRMDTSPLPFLVATLEILKVQDSETRLRVEFFGSDKQSFNKRKIAAGTKQQIFAGFTDDIKAITPPPKYAIYFLNKVGVPVSKVVIEFDEEGFYNVNGQRKGKI